MAPIYQLPFNDNFVSPEIDGYYDEAGQQCVPFETSAPMTCREDFFTEQPEGISWDLPLAGNRLWSPLVIRGEVVSGEVHTKKLPNPLSALGGLAFGILGMGGCGSGPTDLERCEQYAADQKIEARDGEFTLYEQEIKKTCKLSEPQLDPECIPCENPKNIDEIENQLFTCSDQLFEDGRYMAAISIVRSLFVHSSNPEMKESALQKFKKFESADSVIHCTGKYYPGGKAYMNPFIMDRDFDHTKMK